MNARFASYMGLAASASTAVSLFVVFRLSIEILGAATVGSWVLIQSVFFLSRVAEGGVGINLTRTYAVDRKLLGERSPWPYCSAGLILTLVPVVLIGILLLLPGKILLVQYLRVGIEPRDVERLLLLCLVQSLVNATSSVGMAVLEGAGKLSWRHTVTMISNFVFLFGAYPALRWLGLFGLPFLYILASFAAAGMSFLLLRKMSVTSILSSPDIKSRIWGDSLRASGMAGLRAAFEPWTKFLVGSFGSMATVAALDLAFRVSTQVRVAIQSATQPLLYIGARTDAQMTERVLASYTSANAMVVQANWSGLIVLISCAPVVSFLGFGEFSADATIFLATLAIGNAANSLGVIGYYSEVSRGGLSNLLWIHVLMGLINVLGGAIAGWVLGPVGAVAAYSLSFAIGGVALVRLWALSTSTTLGNLVKPPLHLALMAGASLAISGTHFLDVIPRASLLAVSVVASVIFAAFASVLFVRRWRLTSG